MTNIENKLQNIIIDLESIKNTKNIDINNEINNIIISIENSIDNINLITNNKEKYIKNKENEKKVLDSFSPYIIYYRMQLDLL